MSKNCRIEFVEGELVCLCNHRDYRNCDLYEDLCEDLYEEDNETYDDWNTGSAQKNNKYKRMDGSWICPYCGKKVYSMEVHPCSQPTL